MNGQEYKNAFGKAPESFKSRVAFTLSHVEEERKVKKFSVRLVLIAGVILILMAGVVYAASMQWKLFDIFDNVYGRTPGDRLQKALDDNNIRQSFDAGDYVISLEEAIADGKYLYITANVRAKDGKSVYMMPTGVEPDDSISIWAAAAKGKSEGESDQRTFLQAAKEEGKCLVTVNLQYTTRGISHIGGSETSLSYDGLNFALYSGGAISFMLGGRLITKECSLPVDLTLSVQECTDEGGYKESRETIEKFRFDLPVTPPLAKKTIQGNGIKVPDTDASIDRVELILTPLTMHYEIYYTRDPETPLNAEKMGLSGLWFKFVDEAGNAIRDGLSLGGSRGSRDNIHFTQTGSVMMEQMPDTITLQGYERDTGELHGTATMKVD